MNPLYRAGCSGTPRDRAVDQLSKFVTRRSLFGNSAMGLGSLALSSLLHKDLPAGPKPETSRFPSYGPKVNRVIYLFQSGGPSQLDLYDHKPELQKRFGQEVPRSIYPDDRKTTMTVGQKQFPTAPSKFKFERHGASGIVLSELLPHLGSVADELCVVNSMHTEAINHDPAITFFQTGSPLPGRPSIGAWLSYGLGSENDNLPTFVAMTSRGSAKNGQPLYDRLWGSGFLPARFQGVKFRNQGAPVLDLSNPPGVSDQLRKKMLDALNDLNTKKHLVTGDRIIQARIAQYELAYRMQASIPSLTDLGNESQQTLAMYGKDVTTPGKYAYNCLLARRLAEQGVRYIQLFHMGWDQHGQLPKQLAAQCKDTDQPTAALINDLKQRGMLDDTLIIWGGEFGRTVYSQGGLTKANYGRDHHPSCFTMWMAGGGVRKGMQYGQTDDYSVNVAENPVHVHDIQAMLLHLMGIDHERLTYKYQGRYFRLTDVHGRVIPELLA